MNQLLENYSSSKTKRILFAAITTNGITSGTILNLSKLRAKTLNLTFDLIARDGGTYTPIIEAKEVYIPSNSDTYFPADPSTNLTYAVSEDNILLADIGGNKVESNKMAAIATALNAAGKSVRLGVLNRVPNYVRVSVKASGISGGNGATLLIYADIRKDNETFSDINE